MKADVRRRLEHYAANPRCEANLRSVVAGVTMEAVARSAGLEPQTGQSPFALARGAQFERGLFDDDAARLRRGLLERQVLPANAAGFVDLRLKRNGGPMPSLDAARDLLLPRLLSGDLDVSRIPDPAEVTDGAPV
ncbi:MAG: hypothetical protein HY909_19455 [Deltaproteobacteria bacterium]|nr:hypothetical protein [Deltaproteobacteria bacterium]